MKTIAHVKKVSEAYVLKSLLEAEGITVFIPHETSSSDVLDLSPVVTGYDVQVEDASADKAAMVAKDYLASRPETSDEANVPLPRATVKRRRLFRCLICAEMLLGIAIYTGNLGAPDKVPKHVQEYLDGLSLGILTYGFAYQAWWYAALARFVAYIGMLGFISTARHLYLATIVVTILVGPFLGAGVFAGLGNIACLMDWLACGVILTMIYYSPVKEDFCLANRP
jgi:hypothetical protein